MYFVVKLENGCFLAVAHASRNTRPPDLSRRWSLFQTTALSAGAAEDQRRKGTTAAFQTEVAGLSRILCKRFSAAN
jgi:hypothetical protein